MVRREEHVAGMRIRVEDTVDQDLVQVGAKQLFAQLDAVDLRPFERRHCRDLRPVDVVHREDA
ncbi:hypothetical protein D3C83_85110 [compost metagenome]